MANDEERSIQTKLRLKDWLRSVFSPTSGMKVTFTGPRHYAEMILAARPGSIVDWLNGTTIPTSNQMWSIFVLIEEHAKKEQNARAREILDELAHIAKMPFLPHARTLGAYVLLDRYDEVAMHVQAINDFRQENAILDEMTRRSTEIILKNR